MTEYLQRRGRERLSKYLNVNEVLRIIEQLQMEVQGVTNCRSRSGFGVCGIVGENKNWHNGT